MLIISLFPWQTSTPYGLTRAITEYIDSVNTHGNLYVDRCNTLKFNVNNLFHLYHQQSILKAFVQSCFPSMCGVVLCCGCDLIITYAVVAHRLPLTAMMEYPESIRIAINSNGLF